MPSHTPPLLIDKLSITLPVPAERCVGAQQALDELERWSTDLTASRLSKGRYQHRYDLTVPNGKRVDVFSASQGTGNFLKLEYSPNNIEAEGTARLTSFLHSILGDDFREIFFEGKANRVDVAFDVRRIPLADLWIEDSEPNKSALIRGRDRQTETIYLPYQATRQLYVYDKLRQLRDAEKARIEDRSPDWVRFEYRVGKGNYRLSQLANAALENPFNRFSVRRFEVLPELGPFQSRLLFDACRLRGRQLVLGGASGTERERYGGLINQFPVPEFWKRRTSLWGQFKECVEGLLPPFPIL